MKNDKSKEYQNFGPAMDEVLKVSPTRRLLRHDVLVGRR